MPAVPTTPLAVPPRIADPAERGIRLALLIGGVLTVIGCVVLFTYNPAFHGFYPQCWLHRMTGILCPGCGALRATHQLLHGHVLTALQYNAVLVLFLPLAVFWAVRRYFRPSLESNFPSAGWIWTAVIVTIVFTVARNFPAFSWLAP